MDMVLSLIFLNSYYVYRFSTKVFSYLVLCALSKGESVNNWKTDDFRMFECGPLWRPPPMNLFSGGMPEDLIEEADYPYAPGYVPPPQARRNQDSMHDEVDSEVLAASRRCGLTEAQRGRFVQMLLDLEPSRTNIGDVMVWCLEHADAAADITDCLVESISSDNFGTSTEPKDEPEESRSSHNSSHVKSVARLFLISDILFNSSAKVPNASFFRKCLESRLPDVFRSLHSQYKNVEGKLKAEQLKQKVMLCFRAWEDWAIYPNDFLIKLQNIFLGLISEIDDDADLAGVPLEVDSSAIDGTKMSNKNLTVLDSDVEVLQGQPLVQYDGDPLDVDGSPLEATDAQDIAPRPKSCTTSELRVSSPVASGPTPRLFVPSKWETVDPETVESEAVTTSSRWELLVDSNVQQLHSPGSTRKDSIGQIAQSSGLDNWKRITVDEDLDGQPLTSIGSLVAYDDEDAASPSPSDPDVGPHPSTIPLPSTPTRHSGSVDLYNSKMSEERRNQLREIELKVLKYQDELESRRRGDKSVTEEAFAKQIQRYRERLLEKLSEDEAIVRKQSEGSSSKSSKMAKNKPNIDSTKRLRREHSVSPPSSTRDFRDRSPPRSFRERSRRHHSPSTPTDDAYQSPFSRNVTAESPYRSGTTHQHSWETEDDDRRSLGSSVHKPRRPSEELEEGEASDEEDSAPMYSQRISSKRSHYCDDVDRSPSTPRAQARKRQRSRSPDSHGQRPSIPSPSHKRGGVSAASGNSCHRRK